MRMLAPNALLYTEMQVVETVVHNRQRALFFDPFEFPLALQLGGSDPKKLAYCAKLAEDAGFQEINLNLGCPSNKVTSGGFGACLMLESNLVADCIDAMKQVVKIPVTAKTRIGIDEQDNYEFFSNFAKRLVASGCDKLIIHARKAWLKGLSPKQNRTVPPVCYPFVYQLKEELPNLPVIINGDVSKWNEIKEEHMPRVDGVMIGRLACNNPYAIALLHHQFFPEVALKNKHSILSEYCLYVKSKVEEGVLLGRLLKPIINLFYGSPNAKAWKITVMNSIRQKKLSVLLDYLNSQLFNDE